MTASVISCPKCSQLNTTRRLTCKNCGVHLNQTFKSMPETKPIMRKRFWIPILAVIVTFQLLNNIVEHGCFRNLNVNKMTHLKIIGHGLTEYAKDNDGRFPDKLSVLYPNYINNIRLFFYSGEENIEYIMGMPEHWVKDFIDSNGCFQMVNGLNINSDADHLLTYEKSYNHRETAGRHELSVGAYLDFCSNDYNKFDTFINDYELKVINGDKVVINHATGLMWHQSGSDKSMSISDEKNWIEELNSSGYAGYNDWRLPTIKEAASLFESIKMNGNLYIDPVFDNKQSWMWSGKNADHWDENWETITYFDYHHICKGYSRSKSYVRPVRSMK